MQHRVDTLRLAVHSPPGREAVAAGLAERFTRDVLERFTDIVEARSPGRVVLIRRMALRWSYSEAELADPAQVADSAADLAESLAASDGGAPHAGDAVAAFDDEAEWLAAYLRRRAAGAADQWFHAAWREAERHGAGEASPLRRDTVLAALSRLEAAGTLAGVLAGLPAATLTSLGAALESDGAASMRQAPSDAPVDAVAAAAALGDATPPPVSTAEIAAGVDAALSAAVAAQAHQNDGRPRDADEAALSPLAEPDGLGTPATRFGGLFYLLALALELGIGEALWKVCLPEGAILAHAAAALLGADAAADPAPVLFGGVETQELRTCPAISPEQHAEVCTEILAAAAIALPRYGVAPDPAVFLDLAPSPAGRTLVASLGGPFAVFAWPAPDAGAAAAGLAAFLSVWPSAFPPPRAPDALVSLDTSGRLRAASEAMVAAVQLPPFSTLAAGASTPAPAGMALLMQICGTLLAVFARRARLPRENAGEVVPRYLEIPAHVVLKPEAMTLVLPMARIDLAARRAALDRNPGWVPWLRRAVRIEFASEGEEA